MESRKNLLGVLLIIIIILLIALIGLVFYSNFIKPIYNEEPLNVEKQTNSNQNIDNTSSTSQQNNTQVVTKEIVKYVTFEQKNFTLKDGKYNITRCRSDNGVTNVYLKYDGTVYVSVTSNSKDQIKLFYPNFKAEVNKEYQVTGFSGEIVDAIVCGYGQTTNYPFIAFIMKDGSVEYLNSKQAFENLNFKSSGKIPDLSNIIRIEEICITGVSYSGYGPNGEYGIIAIDNTGKVFQIEPYELIK